MKAEWAFPGLKGTDFRVTSDASTEYNCVSWAIERQDVWLWPDAMGDYSWPFGVPRAETLEAFAQALRAWRFEPCDDHSVEKGFVKVALYGKGDTPTHVARQLKNGFWTSKLGSYEDIVHRLDWLVGSFYGTVVRFFKRPVREHERARVKKGPARR